MSKGNKSHIPSGTIIVTKWILFLCRKLSLHPPVQGNNKKKISTIYTIRQTLLKRDPSYQLFLLYIASQRLSQGHVKTIGMSCWLVLFCSFFFTDIYFVTKCHSLIYLHAPKLGFNVVKCHSPSLILPSHVSYIY